MSREVTLRQAILVTPNPCDRIDWSDTLYRVEVDTDPDSEGLDFPILLTLANGNINPSSIHFEPEDAEAVGRALIRAAEMRRTALLPCTS